MTKQRHDEHSTEFGLWLRKEHQDRIDSRICGFSAQNLDYIWHNYKEWWLITIEEKCYCGKTSFAQRDTHGIIYQMLRYANHCLVFNVRGKQSQIDYRGHYLVVFEKTTPDDGWIKVNGRPCPKAAFLELLATGNPPAWIPRYPPWKQLENI